MICHVTTAECEPDPGQARLGEDSDVKTCRARHQNATVTIPGGMTGVRCARMGHSDV